MGNGRPVAIVTGGGTGIGAAIAKRLSLSGYDLVLSGRTESALRETGDQIAQAGGHAVSIAGDISNQRIREELLEGTIRQFGQVNALVNNAALSGDAVLVDALDESIEHFERTLSVNLTAAYALSQGVARQMIQQRNGGSIVQISSVAGRAAQMGAAGYCIAKAGLEAMARSLAMEWASFGIRVNAVAPGDIRTATNSGAAQVRQATKLEQQFVRSTPMQRQGTPEEVADVVDFLVSTRASFVTGSTFAVDGGYLTY